MLEKSAKYYLEVSTESQVLGIVIAYVRAQARKILRK
jgi:hypothetical protein